MLGFPPSCCVADSSVLRMLLHPYSVIFLLIRSFKTAINSVVNILMALLSDVIFETFSNASNWVNKSCAERWFSRLFCAVMNGASHSSPLLDVSLMLRVIWLRERLIFLAFGMIA